MFFLCFFFLSAGLSQRVYAVQSIAMGIDQQLQITGVVKDTNGEPMIGVTVMVKGTGTGTITDIDGKYSVSVPGNKSVLTFSFVGYTTKEVTVGNQKSINVTLSEDSKMIDEVVVIGFQSQKKGNLTASVASVGAEALENRPVANIGQALQGMVPGLNISIEGGDPNKVPSLNIRGATTFRQRGTSNDDKNKFDVKSGSPLILLDGVEITAEDLNQLNPNDIDNMSFLKDASAAAIYGTRATFGVILVTTKGGNYNQKAKIDYSYNLAFDQPYELPDILDSYYIYKALRDKEVWTGTIAEYSQHDRDMLDHMMAYMKDPVNNKPYFMEGDAIQWVGNTNPYKELVKSWTPTQKHNLSISGGGDRISYYISLGMQDQKGMYEIKTDRLKRYNAMLSINAKVTKWFNVAAKASYNVFDYEGPTQQTDGMNLWSYAKSYYPENFIYQPVLTGPDDFLPNHPTENPVSYLYAGGRNISSRRKTILSISPEFTIIPKILKIKADLSVAPTTYQKEKTHPKQARVNNSWTALETRWATENTGEVTRSTTDRYAINVYADYNQTFKEKHNVSVLLGLNQEEESYAGSTLYLKNMLDPYILNPELVQDVTANTSANSHHEIASRALFGRIMYNYMSRYLIELDARYDGSSKFPKDSRFQFFPTVSLGWRVSEEKFMEWSKDWLDNFKIRLSAGSMGNGNIDPYKYIDYMTIKTSTVVIGDALGSYTTAPGAIPLSLTWETATTYDVGFDMDLFRNRLSIGFDWYRRYTTDMYTVGVSLPSVYGTDAPKGNNASLKTNGWELSVGWRDSFELGGKAFSYNVKAMVWDARTWVTEYINPTGALGDYYEGKELGEIWGYRVEGLFRDQEDIDSHAEQSFLQTLDKVTRPGQVKFADLNQDGKIDRGAYTTADPGDLTVIGNETPRYCYGINLGFNWNGIGISTFWQGVGKKDWYPRYDSGFFWGQYNRPFGYMLKQHTGDKVYREELDNWDTAYWPRYTTYQTHQSSVNRPLTINNDRYMQDVSYIRLKNITVDYTFPDRICKKLHIKGLKVWVSGENLWTYSPMFEHCDNYDPEVINAGDSDFRTSEGDGYSYPMLRTVTLGVNLSF